MTAARMKNVKTALVLAGGGLTGAVYEIGALRAIDDLLVERTVNDFDIFVGTSAGALVASMLAKGITPEAMFAAINGSHPEIRPIERRDVFNLSRSDYVRSGLKLPGKILAAWSNYLRHRHDMTLFDFFWSLSDAMPSGLYDGLALERYVRETLLNLGYSNRFDDLERELYIIATNLDDGRRAVFGPHYRSQVPISQAVAASSAMPLFYKPVLIADNEYVDGGLRGNASLDLAIEHGAKLVVCINPVVPFDNVDHTAVPLFEGGDGFISEKGVQAVASQMFAILLHSGLHYHIKQLRRRHRDVDIILIEPRSDDYEMHFHNIMRYSARLTIARHGFESVTLDLAEDFEGYRQILARHQIPVSRRLLVEEMQEIVASDYDPDVLRRILNASPRRPTTVVRPLRQLGETLAELDLLLQELDGDSVAQPSPDGAGDNRQEQTIFLSQA